MYAQMMGMHKEMACYLSQSSRIPLETNSFELRNAIGRDSGALSLDELAPLAALVFAPGAERLVGIRHVDVPTVGLEINQGGVVLVPAGRVRLPHETNLLQSLQACFGEGGMLSLLAKLVLVALAFHPLSEL